MTGKKQKNTKQPQATKPEIRFALDPVIEAYKKDVDRTLLIENLRLTVEQRFQKFEAFMQLAMELRRAGSKFRQEKNSGPMRQNQTGDDSNAK